MLRPILFHLINVRSTSTTFPPVGRDVFGLDKATQRLGLVGEHSIDLIHRPELTVLAFGVLSDDAIDRLLHFCGRPLQSIKGPQRPLVH